MIKKIFSQNYYGSNQKKFKQFLAAENVQAAYETIKKFPATAKTYEEEVNRLITIGEAHKALAEFLLYSDRKENSEETLEKISQHVQRSRL